MSNDNDLSGNGRGVALYVKEDVHCSLLYVDSKYDDFVVLQMESGVDEKLLIGIFYRSPNNSPESVRSFFTLLNLICSKFNCRKILVGDFNFTQIDWASVSGTRSSCSMCNKFVDILQKKISNTTCSVSY